jgi:polyhydroxybutyrate depolymerase
MRRALLALVAACGSSSPGTPASDAPAGDPDAEPQPACGMRGGARGLSQREVTIDGLRRTYLVYLPPGRAASEPLPVIFVHHGFTMSGQLMHDITQHVALADAEGIALAFPDGQGPGVNDPPWNVGSDVCPSSLGPPPIATGDDFALLDHMKADIDADQCIDRDHLFVTGFSMGGYYSHHAGCMRSDIAGVAPHSGGTHALDECATDGKPIIIFHGGGDTLIPAGCSDPDALPVANVTPAADAWAERNGCSLTTTSRAVTGGACVTYENCPVGRQVELCTFPGMGHCWAGGDASAGIYSCPARASATQLAWDFFRQYAW